MAAIVIGFIGYVPYIRGILIGTTFPHVFSWIVWGILTFIGFFAQVADGGGAGTWVTGITGFVCVLVAVLAWVKGRKGLDIARSDVWVFAGALCAIPLWYFTGSPLWSVVLITIIDAMGFYPTFRKAFYKPDEEVLFTYICSAVKFLLSIMALANLSLITVLYPASLVVMNGGFVVMVLLRRQYLKSLQHG